VIVNDIGTDEAGRSFAEHVVEEIKQTGGQAIANRYSVADREAAPAIIDAAIEAFGRVDAVINNAGETHFSRFEDTSLELLESQLALHLIGYYLVTQGAYRSMIERGYGRIVLVSSPAAIFGRYWGAAYGSAKAAHVGLMNVIAMEGAERGVLTNMVLPSARSTISRRATVIGDVDTPDPNRPERLTPRADPTFVAPLTLYLASNRCTTTHGIYMANLGTYARVFIALGRGWRSAQDEIAPSVEDIAAHWEKIGDFDGAVVPETAQEASNTARQGVS
jgi:NAD(P)-dependent dehydrogenase (short-subunit alcohol dehydrogenase family)